MLRAATVFTNGGMLLAPIIIDRIEEPDGNVRLQKQPPTRIRSHIADHSPKHALDDGTSRGFRSRYHARLACRRFAHLGQIWGQVKFFDPQTGQYYPERVNSSAIVIFPTDDPNFIFYVNIFNPKSSLRWGGRLISPMVTEAIAELTNRYNLPLKGNRIAYLNEDVQTLIEELQSEDKKGSYRTI